MSLADSEFRRVVATDPLDELPRAGAADFDFTHVADVEQAGAFAHGFMLGDDAGVFQGISQPPKLTILRRGGGGRNSVLFCAIRRQLDVFTEDFMKATKHRR